MDIIYRICYEYPFSYFDFFIKRSNIIFDVSSETSEALQVALPICSLSLPFYAFSRITTEYFNAIKLSRYATFMVY